MRALPTLPLDGTLAGILTAEDPLRGDVSHSIDRLRRAGLRIVVASGDSQSGRRQGRGTSGNRRCPRSAVADP